MNIWHIALLSVVQGLTEFLPISSSGHLLLLPALTHLPDQGLNMDLAVHIGTLMAVLVYYHRDIWQIGVACLPWNKTPDMIMRRLGIYIVLATIPAVIFGFILHKTIPEGIRNFHIVAATTIVFGLLMGLADKMGSREKTLKDMTLKSALLIGFAQMVALIPGTSRSGITMTTARSLGFDRVDAARFSFLLSIPATAGAGLLGVVDVVKQGNVALGYDMAIAAVMTFFAGLFAITFMMRWLKRFGLMPFVIYRIILGIALIAFIFLK